MQDTRDDRIRHVCDYRIAYTGEKAYRCKNVELRIVVDRPKLPFGETREECEKLTDKIWLIFVQETTFIQFDLHAPEAISGEFSSFEQSKFYGIPPEDELFVVEFNYIDYGSNPMKASPRKWFERSFSFKNSIKLWNSDESHSEFWLEVRRGIEKIISSELTGRPGRRPSRQMRL